MRTAKGHRVDGTTAALALLCLVTAISLVWRIHPYYDPRNDSSIYILTAQALLDGQGYSYQGEPFVIRPPGLPVLLLPVLALVGTDMVALHIYISLFGILCICLFFLYLRPRLGVPIAFAAALAIWFNPQFGRVCQQVMSDIPGACLMLAALMVERRARGCPSFRRDLVLGLLIGVSGYIRTLLLFLLPAILLSRLLRWWREDDRELWARFVRRQVILIVIPIAVCVPWEIRNAVVAPSGVVENLGLHSYSVAMWHADRGDPSSPLVTAEQVLRRIPVRLNQILPLIGGRMHEWTVNPRGLLFATPALVCWIVVLVRRREPAEIYAAVVLAVLSVYFSFTDRLVWPVYLIIFANLLEGTRFVMTKIAGSRAGPALATSLVALLLVGDFDARYRLDEIARGHERRLQICDYLAQEFPPDAALAALNGRHLSVLLDRTVLNLQHAVERDGWERAQEIIDSQGVVGIVICPPDNTMLGHYLTERYGVQVRFGVCDVFRVR